MGVTCRRYRDIRDFKSICNFLEKIYSSYGTRYYNNITLFEFQCALSCGLGETVKDIEEVLSDAFIFKMYTR